MTDMDKAALHEIAQTRAKYFTPRWFGDLMQGRLTPGDTFWIGNLGIWLFAAPALVLATMLLTIAAPETVIPMLVVASAALAVYRFALLRGLWITSRRCAPMHGWHWAAIIITLMIALTEIGIAIAKM